MAGAIENRASLRGQFYHLFLPRPCFPNVVLMVHYLQCYQFG
jgi:hypothetical protein